jgi:hypothetical protein
VALRALQKQFLDDGVTSLLEVGNVVVLQELARATVAADAVALLDDPLLAPGWVPVRA